MADTLRQVFSTVASGVLGRTNRVFPPVWLSLAIGPGGEDLNALVAAAIEADAPIDVSSHPALWGGKLRGSSPVLMCAGNFDFENATSESHASDLVQANLIEVLSSIGRERIDFFFLRCRRMTEEYQISGALQTLDWAKEEGLVGHIGISSDGPSMATLGFWQFHDAFEVLLVPRNHYDDESYRTLSPLARERRVGIVTSRPLNWGYGLPFTALPAQWRLTNLTQSFYGLTLVQAVIADLAEDHPVLVGVRTVEEVRQAIQAPSLKRPEGLSAMLQPFVELFDDESQWTELLSSSNALFRDAAKRRLA
ncbi:MAG: hypothetical protein P4L46_06810 [Fimbriimonas sp.]|nr:hypothetical protein [Fimbriimonas sp.]